MLLVRWADGDSAALDLLMPLVYGELRKTAVARLRALNDPRAVSALERALVRKIKSGPMRNKPYSGCLLDDAKAAIGYLKGLPPKQQKS